LEERLLERLDRAVVEDGRDQSRLSPADRAGRAVGRVLQLLNHREDAVAGLVAHPGGAVDDARDRRLSDAAESGDLVEGCHTGEANGTRGRSQSRGVEVPTAVT